MRQSSVRFLVVWLCLFSFGLDMAVHALGSVVCISEGGVRFEWTCEKDDHGLCLATKHAPDATSDPARETGASGHDQPAPCRDLPVDDDHDRAHHLLVQAKQDGPAAFTLPPVAFTILPAPMFVVPVRLVRAGLDAAAHPPDLLGRLATIVMIV